ncbi:GNAT family N-acetyltransferase [Candidatus Contubernalis alkaliaceticus]|uniref:GNAT family N-acetyltransferase n=1 Tax=Candidatus Contubernalis alkaliaceticus TaxID=338645 RepID=UPI001F4BF76E|nr:GNAT family protein [Candidatus Contubernalis alkalaceticus]UNC93578.1 GNAT family N-acetyltransferase [Candidatus Contubernalis alkalaceticus]
MDLTKFRVYVRAFEPEDYKTTITWRRDEELWSLLTGRRYYVSSEYERKWVNDAIFDNQDNVRLAVCLKENDLHIGNTSLDSINWLNRNAWLGTMIGDKRYRSQGYGSEIAILMLQHGFYDLGLERISIDILLSNTAAYKGIEKCGFKHEGVFRHAVYKNGKFEDLKIMSCLRQDFEEVLKKESLYP